MIIATQYVAAFPRLDVARHGADIAATKDNPEHDV
jgi:hypothetical protein